MPVRRINRNQPEPEPTRRVVRRGTDPQPSSLGKSSKPAPARRPAEADEDDDGKVRTGWGGYKSTKEAAPSRWPKRYQVESDGGEQLLKFLEDAPFASYNMHWCDWLPRGQKLSYICLGEDCPVCDVDSPSPRVCFNILDLAGDEPALKVWETGITITDMLLKYGEDSKTGPLGRNDIYFAVQMSGGKKKTTTIRPVKARDVEEDFNFELLTPEEIKSFQAKMWDASSIERTPRSEMQKIADAATD